MHDGQRTRGDPSTIRVEDVLTVDLPDDEWIDRQYLGQVFANPRKYLTPRGIRARREAERALDEQHESVLARRCKQTGLLVAFTLLISAVIAAAVLAEEADRHYAGQERARHAITGVEALGAFTVRQSHSPEAGRGTPATAAAVPDVDTQAPSSPAAEPAPATHHNATDTSTSAEAATSSAGTTRDSRIAPRTGSASQQPTSQAPGKLDTVRRFYRLMATAPSDALGMLGPNLLGDGPGNLLDAWRALEDVRVHKLSLRADGSVLAVLTMSRPDGQRVRVTQVLRFAGEQIIDHVQLLSAQHF